MAKCVRNSKHLLIIPFLLLSCIFLVLCGSGIASGENVDTDTLNGIIRAQGKNWVAKDYPERKGLGALRETYNIFHVDVSQEPTASGPLPATFDWSNHTNPNNVSYVTPVKDQGDCGSCWIFSSVGVLESKILIDNKMGGLNKDLSEQIMVTFVYPPPSGNGCNGGYPGDAANFLQSTGVSLETCYPYTGTDGSPGNACADWAGYLDKPSKPPTQTYKITGWSSIAQSVTALKTALYNQGPLVVTMAVYDDFFSYSSGVYSYTSGALAGYHAIELVGWDDTNQCFIVKNSWGTGWGENGFFRIAYSQVTSTCPVDFAYEALAYTSSAIADAPLPLADFYIQSPNTGSGITTAGAPPFTVAFHDTSISKTPVISWAYNFGDGGTSTLQSPTHVYTTPGIYTVTLEVGNAVGMDTTTYTDIITVYGVNFTATPTTGVAPLQVQFYNESPGATSFLWNFGDGGTSTAAAPSHTYAKAGTYSVTLTVTNPSGQLTTTKTGFITANALQAPVANMTATPGSGNAPLPVQFASTSTGTISSYSWNFGDGGTSTSPNPSHSYTTAGTYTATLTVTGPGGTNAKTTTIKVNTAPPVANMTASKTSGDIPLPVQFTSTSTGTITSYSWTFGDGGTSTSQNPSHTYTTAGTYTATLSVTGPGGTGTKTATITANPAAPVANLTATPTSGKAPLAVQFTSTSTGTISSYSWTFGDGATSTSQNPSHSYSTAGTYTATLSATGPGGTSTKTATITATPAAPVANLTATPTSGKAPLAVQFTSTSTGTITSYSWTFGDGGTSTSENPSHTYTAAGTYTATLTVTGPGGTSTKTATITTTPPAPVANLTATPASGNAPLAVQFTSTSTGTISSYSWNFGDGTTSASQSPQHTYTNVGTYTAQLTVTGPAGTSTKTATITTTPPAPVANLTATPASGKAPLAVQFTSTSTGTITSYSWNFGDGTTSTSQNPKHTYTKTGSFTAQLAVTGPGGTSTKTATITTTITTKKKITAKWK